MSKSLKYLATSGVSVAVMLTIAYNFADRNITPLPPAPPERVAAAVTPDADPMMSAHASTNEVKTFGLGRPALPEEIAAWNVDVAPDGTGLPVGEMDVFTGEEVFVDQCAACHGDFAEGSGNWPKLAGGRNTLADEDPLKTVGSYWPHLSTAFDYVNRSMPYGNAQSLSADEVYGIVAYILYSNDLVDDDFVLSNENFMEVMLPNAEGFILDDRDIAEAHFWTDTPCMTDCKETVVITMRAAVLDVTPEDEGVEEEAAVTPAVAPATAPEATEVTATAETEAPVTQNAVLDPELVAAGERAFRQCQACHKVGEDARNGSGPLLNGVVGHTIAQVDGFRYSNTLQAAGEAGQVWTDEALAKFLEDPRGAMPGTKMSFRGVRKPEDAIALIAYLRSFDE
jgi:cytochrome c2